jgi:hypothetical protein
VTLAGGVPFSPYVFKSGARRSTWAAMPNTSLRSALDSLAHSFASGVLAAIRAASIDDLLAESGGGAPRSAGRLRGGGGGTRTKTTKSGRLARRSAKDIAKAVDQVVVLVKKSKTGLRSEEIKKALGLDVREVPRILKTAVKTRKLKAKGQKRATTYTAK